MKILIIGRSEVLYETCLLLKKHQHQICGIITSREAPEYLRTALDFENLAKDLSVPFLYSADINSLHSLNFIKGLGKIDIGVSFNCVNIIEAPAIKLPALGILNAHSGDLPKYRGNACQAWAILNGEKHIALCVHKMVPNQLDSGDIIARKKLNIDINTTIGVTLRWMLATVPHLFLEALDKLGRNKNYVLKKQSTKRKDVLRCYPRKPEDALIDWKKSNVEILRLINASSEPYGGAFTYYKNARITIWKAEILKDAENFCAVPGQVCAVSKVDGSIVVICGTGKIKIIEINYNGARIKPAHIVKSLRDRLTSPPQYI